MDAVGWGATVGEGCISVRIEGNFTMVNGWLGSEGTIAGNHGREESATVGKGERVDCAGQFCGEMMGVRAGRIGRFGTL